MAVIRSYRSADAACLAPIHTAVFPEDALSPAAFAHYIGSILAVGGKTWTIALDDPVGYALSVPVPGLPHTVDLKGCIAPAHQRRGFGSLLLGRVVSDLHHTPIRQISYQTDNLSSRASRFLQKHRFSLEHEEWLMVRPNLYDLPVPGLGANIETTTYLRSAAVEHFHDLFAAAFGGRPWDQPYSRQEIESALENPEDILFLTADSQPIGFAWLHLHSDGTGAIEPLGILPAYQGQGCGRLLLTFALHELSRRGAARAQIGAWVENQPAINLYRSLGFIHKQTISFLAYNLSSSA